MSKVSDDHSNDGATPAAPKTTADFGGRRKIFERRLKHKPIHHPDRRRGDDRRSGFDRRSTSEDQTEETPENSRSDRQP